VPTGMLTKDELETSTPLLSVVTFTEGDEIRASEHRQAARVRRLRINAMAWFSGTVLLTTLWIAHEWQANGALASFGHEGAPGQWNPTLWAVAVGAWGLIVGIMALRVHFERPVTEADVDTEVERWRSPATPAGTEHRYSARTWLERVRRLRFHVAAWGLGMVVLTPLWALIEWQDNGGLERLSNESQPGSWEPWILYVGGLWALAVAVFALRVYLHRPVRGDEVERQLQRLRSRD
jgi:hypothetical protein